MRPVRCGICQKHLAQTTFSRRTDLPDHPPQACVRRFESVGTPLNCRTGGSAFCPGLPAETESIRIVTAPFVVWARPVFPCRRSCGLRRVRPKAGEYRSFFIHCIPAFFPKPVQCPLSNHNEEVNKMKDKVFGVLQRVGRSFMLPIALLPVAGLLLGIGSSFTNETMLETYGLTGLIHQGTVIYTVLDIMNQCGSAVFNNLALLFAMGVAIGMAKKEKEVAALSGAIAYLVMNTAISAMINAAGGVEAMAPNTTTSMLGITTLQMGVFGGIIVGLGVAGLHN